MKTQHEKISGILLAGGRSTRMGRNKGMIRIGDLLMYQYPLRILESLCDEILISTCQPLTIEEDHEQVCDEVPGTGPAGGIMTCLQRSSHDLNIVVSYDMPLLHADLFRLLLENARIPFPDQHPDELQKEKTGSGRDEQGSESYTATDQRYKTMPLKNRVRTRTGKQYDIILPEPPGSPPEPLCGIYRKSALPVFRKLTGQGTFAVHLICSQAHTLSVPVGPPMPFYHDRLFENVNSLSELDNLPGHLLK
jgi:molybdopterin-guanine dinucleotide biosynthesis protein A